MTGSRESMGESSPAGDAAVAGRAIPALWQGHSAWQIALRWWVPPAILVALAVGDRIGFQFASYSIAVVALAILAYNVALYLVVRLRPVPEREQGAFARRLDLTQVALDYGAMFALIYLTGGASSPLVFFFVFHVIFAAILFRPRVAWALAAVVVAGMLALAFAAWYGWLVPLTVAYRGVVVTGPDAPAWTAVLLAFFAASVFTTAGTTTAVMERLRAETARAYAAEDALARERSRFVLQVTHNLRAPLAASLSMLDVVRQGYVGELADEQLRLLDRVHARLAAMGNLVGELLALARSRDGGSRRSPSVVDLVEIARTVAMTFAAEATAAGLELDLVAPDDAVAVLGDGDLLRQMLENLVSNAVKYTPSGDVTIEVGRQDGTALLEVRDTGIGIPVADQPRLFEEFFRATNVRAGGVPGTGLGLALVAEVVRGHGGAIDVASVEGGGSRFTVRLPLAGASSEAAARG